MHLYLKISYFQRCHVCGSEVRLGFLHHECKKKSFLDGLIFLTVYNKLSKDLVHKGKYNGEYSIFYELGEIMKQYFNKFYSFPDVVFSYVPSYRKKERLRGFNQAEILSKTISNNSLELLERTRDTPTQASMGEKNRSANLKNAFKIKYNLNDLKTILLIDDVYTTGSTLEECARTLKNEKTDIKVFAFTFAKARIR